jgi:hypothetical protein
MNIPWQKMTVTEFAAFDGILGRRSIAVDGIFWTEVRPFFYRPLSPYQQIPAGQVKLPASAWLGGFQHAVPPAEDSNSFMNLLLFEQTETYSVESLSAQHRRQVKAAAKQIVIRPITDREEFKANAYATYISFYERTRYPFGSQRTNRDFFNWWTDELFKIPKAVILGGFLNGRLSGVSVSLLVEETLRYPTVFCDTESLRAHLSSFMLHAVRAAVAEQRCARRIFVGLCKAGSERSVDQFYLQRGCHQVRLPSRLRLNRLTAFGLKIFAPETYGRLIGNIKDIQEGPDIGRVLLHGKPDRRVISGEPKKAGSGEVIPPR